MVINTGRLHETHVKFPRSVEFRVAGVLGEVLEVQGSLGELCFFPGACDRRKVCRVRNTTNAGSSTYLLVRVARCSTACAWKVELSGMSNAVMEFSIPLAVKATGVQFCHQFGGQICHQISESFSSSFFHASKSSSCSHSLKSESDSSSSECPSPWVSRGIRFWLSLMLLHPSFSCVGPLTIIGGGGCAVWNSIRFKGVTFLKSGN